VEPTMTRFIRRVLGALSLDSTTYEDVEADRSALAQAAIVVVLAGIQEHDVREVARLLDLPEGTVKSRLFLARQQLKERLQWTISDTPRR